MPLVKFKTAQKQFRPSDIAPSNCSGKYLLFVTAEIRKKFSLPCEYMYDFYTSKNKTSGKHFYKKNKGFKSNKQICPSTTVF